MLELARDERFDVTIVAPSFMDAALRPINLEANQNSNVKLIALKAWFTKKIHIFFYQGLSKLIRRGEYDIIHLWEEPYILSGFQVAWLAKRAGIPYVFSSYQNLNKNYPWPFSFFERYVVSHAKAWVAWASLVYDNLLARSYPKEKAHLIYPGIDGTIFYPSADKSEVRSKLNLTSGTLFVFVARLVEDKGVSVLLSALEKLKGEWSLLILGAGPLKERIEIWASANQLSERVKIMLAKHDEVPSLLRACDVLVAPSQTMPNWKEQFGRMLVEAFASKVAVIASDSGEIPRVVGEAGLIVGEKNVQALTQAMQAMIDDPVLQKRLANEGYERFLSHFQQSTVVQKHIELYQSMLK